MKYEEFRETKYFPELDGLRALSILLVISIHTTDPLWAPLKGNVGVTIFFVISGFIITTLLLREEDRRGQVRIGAFYARRAFRILPVYYLVLLAYIVLIGVLKVQPGAADLWQALPYFATYQNDFAHSDSGFSVTWSLAIEEKFYLFWPLLFLPAVPRVWRWRVAALLAVAVAPFALAPGDWTYPAIYAPIIDGCLVALLMHNPRGYSAVRPLTGGYITVLLLVTAAAQEVLFENDENVHVVFALLVALAVPTCLTGPEWLRRLLRSRLMVYIGTRSYILYLIHRLGKGAIDRLIAPGGTIPDQILRFLLITSVGLVGAEVLRRLVEQPMIQLGRRLTSRDRSGRPRRELEPTVDRPEHPVTAAAEAHSAATAESPNARAADPGEPAMAEAAFPAADREPGHRLASISGTVERRTSLIARIRGSLSLVLVQPRRSGDRGTPARPAGPASGAPIRLMPGTPRARHRKEDT
jgi:peptidoglycan/LPS O-acetylase OafA/YrhL